MGGGSAGGDHNHLFFCSLNLSRWVCGAPGLKDAREKWRCLGGRGKVGRKRKRLKSIVKIPRIPRRMVKMLRIMTRILNKLKRKLIKSKPCFRVFDEFAECDL